jgi:cation diffusion facilitator CzcD-associated flavoprotein CzcO
MPDVRGPTVAIIGAGMSGLCMGIKLERAGFEDFTIFEKAGEVGGTWRENTYPGLSCDVPSRFYSYSFEPNPDWSRNFSPGPEIWAYFRGIADRYGLRPRIRFGQEVTGARWDGQRWRLRTAAGEEAAADVLVSACGVLHHPRVPEIPGLERFGGAAFHSSRWDHSVPLDGRAIGVIGTGSTGVQLVSDLAYRAGRLELFQRTAQWVLPLPNLPYSGLTRWLLRRWPALSRFGYRAAQEFFEHGFGRAVVEPCWQRTAIGAICRANLRTVRDAELRRRLTPDYEPMCKRLVMSGGFYRAMQRPNVRLVTESIDHIEEEGVVTADGEMHKLDVIAFATGFQAHSFLRPTELVGEDGLTLDQAWRIEPFAYRTVALPGFPNFFMIMGPHSPFGNQSLVAVAETQADYIVEWVRMLADGRVAAAAPSAQATERYNQQMRDAMPQTVWVTGCNSWYIGADGLPMNWPWTPADHREMLREPDLGEFETRAPAARAAPA